MLTSLHAHLSMSGKFCIKSARVTFLEAGVWESNNLVYEPKVCVFKKAMSLKYIYIYSMCMYVYTDGYKLSNFICITREW